MCQAAEVYFYFHHSASPPLWDRNRVDISIEPLNRRIREDSMLKEHSSSVPCSVSCTTPCRRPPSSRGRRESQPAAINCGTGEEGPTQITPDDASGGWMNAEEGCIDDYGIYPISRLSIPSSVTRCGLPSASMSNIRSELWNCG